MSKHKLDLRRESQIRMLLVSEVCLSVVHDRRYTSSEPKMRDFGHACGPSIERVYLHGSNNKINVYLNHNWIDAQ